VAAPLTVVVGAGISGLACAYALKKSGVSVLVLEASARPGGVIQSVRDNGFLCELGPQSFSGTSALFQLCDEVGVSSELVAAPHAAPRYIWLNGEFVRVPMSPGAFLGSKLLGGKTKRSILSEVFRTSHAPEEDESVAAFVRRKFTEELLDKLVGPFVSGIYAGDPEKLSLRAAFPKLYEAEKLRGSVIRGSFRLAKKNVPAKQPVKQTDRRRGLYSFRDSNQTLTDAIGGSLGESLRCGVRATMARNGNKFLLQLDSAHGSETIRADKLVLATPAAVTRDLLGELAPDAVPPAMDIEYAQVAVVSVGYRKEQIANDLNGFGFLIPRSQKIRTLGCVWNSSLFPNRAPQGHVLMTSFIGGVTDAALGTAHESEIATIVRQDLEKLLKISGSPAFERVTKYAAAIPQYNLGHLRRLDNIRKAVARIPGLFIAGNYWNGPAIGACIENSFAVAEQVGMS
jgi:oxygen-dependent protoporphyrinogen oxidase